MSVQHFVSISGGKDSTATYLLAIERGRPFRAVFADTGNEHPLTLDYVRRLPDLCGGPPIEWVSADFTGLFAARRNYIAANWGRPYSRGDKTFPAVPQHLIDRAIECMIPTGNPFLDLCMLKGRYPGVKSRFCTEDLKLRPMDEQIKLPILNAGRSIIEWIGERAQESKARADKKPIERLRWAFDISGDKPVPLPRPVWRVLYRPIHAWKVPEVFALAKRHGVPPNPLYLQGMNRVGCMPCIMAKKGELRQIAKRFPEHIDRIEQWESIVQQVSRRQNATFFAAKMVPGRGDTRAAIRKAVEWADTSRGGWNFDIEHHLEDQDEPEMCSSGYGLCE